LTAEALADVATTDRRTHTVAPAPDGQLAQTAEQFIAAQALRYRVFGDELGATLRSSGNANAFDKYC